MTVKTIFKVLLASIAIPVVGFLLVEYYNVSAISAEIGKMAETAAYQSAVLFNIENYKVGYGEGSRNGLGNQRDILSDTGEVFVSGKFYTGDTPDEIYHNIYSSTNFTSWIKSDVIRNKGKWKNITLIDSKINKGGYGLSEEDAKTATILVESMITPVNIGVAYLDKDVVNKMFRWSIGELFSSGKAQNIKKDAQGMYYSSYNGFKVYASLATINELEYRVYDLTNATDRVAFEGATNVKADKLGVSALTSGDDQSRVAVVGIEYSIPVGYEGVTPLKRMFEFMWDTEVSGLDGKSQRDSVRQRWNDSLASYDSGGFSGNAEMKDILPVPGKLVFFLTR